MDDAVATNQCFGGLDGGQRNPTKTVDIDVLTCQEKVFYLRLHRQLRVHQIVALFSEAIIGAFLVAVIVTDGEW